MWNARVYQLQPKNSVYSLKAGEKLCKGKWIYVDRVIDAAWFFFTCFVLREIFVAAKPNVDRLRAYFAATRGICMLLVGFNTRCTIPF